MKSVLLVVGKTDDKYLNEGIDKYCKRIVKYLPFEMQIITDIKNTKNLSEEVQKQKEGELILKKLQPSDYIVLCDEKGNEYNSERYAKWLNSVYLSGYKRLVFIIGGAYGFSSDVYQKANSKLSLSKMTFSHQMIRLLFVEQYYRAQTILKGEPYHHV